MERLPFSPAQWALGLGICLILSTILMVYSLWRIRRRWLEGQEALKQLRKGAHDVHLEMQRSVGAATNAAESATRSE